MDFVDHILVYKPTYFFFFAALFRFFFLFSFIHRMTEYWNWPYTTDIVKTVLKLNFISMIIFRNAWNINLISDHWSLQEKLKSITFFTTIIQHKNTHSIFIFLSSFIPIYIHKFIYIWHTNLFTIVYIAGNMNMCVVTIYGT